MEIEKNEEMELRDYLIENNFPQSFLELIDELYKNNLLTIIER